LSHHPSADVRDAHLRALRSLLGLKELARVAVPRPRAPARPVLQDENLGLFVPGARMAVRGEDKPEWQFLQLLLSYPEIAGPAAEAVNLDWLLDDRVRELTDYALALFAEGRGLSLVELNERLPESLREALSTLEIPEGDDPERVRRALSDYLLGLEKRHLTRLLKTGARDLAEILEIQKRIKALEARRVVGG
jgi:hypothetical protein